MTYITQRIRQVVFYIVFLGQYFLSPSSRTFLFGQEDVYHFPELLNFSTKGSAQVAFSSHYTSYICNELQSLIFVFFSLCIVLRNRDHFAHLLLQFFNFFSVNCQRDQVGQFCQNLTIFFLQLMHFIFQILLFCENVVEQTLQSRHFI